MFDMPVFLVVGISLGSIFGYLWYRIVGCSTGACPLTSNPWITTLYGAVVGGIISWR